MKISPTMSSKSATARNNSMYKDIEENSGCLELAIGMLMVGLSIFFMIVSYFYQQTGSISRLHLGVGVAIVIILLYVISIWRYIVIRYRIRKQIKVKYGSINRKMFKEELNRDKYYTCFIVIIMGLTMAPFTMVFISVIIYLALGINIVTDVIEVVFMLFYMPADFFFGNETEIVTYVSESSYIHPETTGSKVKSTDIYGSYVVNFQTSDGELLSLKVEEDQKDPNGYLQKVRSFSNTEIKYIPRTGVYVP